jgi:hypothetical protein
LSEEALVTSQPIACCHTREKRSTTKEFDTCQSDFVKGKDRPGKAKDLRGAFLQVVGELSILASSPAPSPIQDPRIDHHPR